MLKFIEKIYFPENIITFLQKSLINNKHILIDLWLIPHFIFGFFLGFFIKNKYLALIILLIFEFFENLVLQPANLSKYEPLSNVILDIVVALFGYFLTRFYIKKV